jgi:hypothetical protein
VHNAHWWALLRKSGVREMLSALGETNELPKWLVALLAFFVSIVSVITVAEPLRGIFRTSFGQGFSYAYLLIVSIVISTTIYICYVRCWHNILSLSLCIFSGYFGSVLAYYFIAMPSLVKEVRAGHVEVLFVAPIIPFHVVLAAAALGASLLMWGLFAIYKWWRHSST